jgi:hypothetical protein
MLAQNFKSAADLDITDKQLEGLIQVLGLLEREEVTHVRVCDTDCFYNENRKPPVGFTGAFNMGNIYTVADCQTAACIAGTADLFCGTDFAPAGDLRFGDLPGDLIDLFCPNVIETEAWEAILPSQAAAALRNYLTLGEARWDEVLGV